jgi:hypothetical protein
VTTINEASGVINKASLTITADDKTRIYGDANPAFTGSISGFVAGETLATSGVTGSADYSSGALQSSNAGAYAITPSAGTLTAGNYSFTSFVNGTLAITKAPLTVTAADATKIFGDPNPAFSAWYSGFKLGQNQSVLGGSISFDTPATPTSSAGQYRITPGGLASDNYQIAFVDGILIVQPSQSIVQQNALIVSVNNANGTVTQTTVSMDQTGDKGSEGTADKDKDKDKKTGGQSQSNEGQDGGTRKQALPYCN